MTDKTPKPGTFDSIALGAGYAEPTHLTSPITPLSTLFAIHGMWGAVDLDQGSLQSLRKILRLAFDPAVRTAMAVAAGGADYDAERSIVDLSIADAEAMYSRLATLTGVSPYVHPHHEPTFARS
ncbi:hypothetical protein FV218_21320 [Methylobacterium sp. WL69]|uniref:hypothetical protein n=1 Tax=Methylobacterium sp. WL69 TaxID=2603893 RepID=UPI0011C755ED|nr:hypothetical protein [Methylobacterium sp. WL69]TXM65431.1 hypothetical protein FV218_21320 [Methylobacterium sp. WL69]